MPYILGLDPGAEGGLVCFHAPSSSSKTSPSSILQLSFSKDPEVAHIELLDFLKERSTSLNPKNILIEKVSGYAGGFGQPGSHMFNFGQSFFALKSAVYAWEGAWPIEVRPQEWQARLGLKRDKKKAHKTTTQWKSFLLKKAEELFPTIKFSKQTADAALIAYYGCLTQEER